MPRFIHHRLMVYQKSLEFIRDIDPIVAAWPRERGYLRWQMRDSASSTGLNIAEAAHDFSKGDKCRIFRYALRSAGESVGNLDQALILRLNSERALARFYDELNGIIAMLTPLSMPVSERGRM